MFARYVLITGGAGFIGTNVARSYLRDGRPVHIFDNLSRDGVHHNLEELQSEFPGGVHVTEGDVRDNSAVKLAVSSAAVIYHLAAQVAVTTSLERPMHDAETNLLGTLNVLEAIRENSRMQQTFLFTSTNKVYGHLEGIALRERKSRYEPTEQRLARSGAAEDQPLEFLSPYGCSKGSADQYVLDYAHSYKIRACVFRMSCIYGPQQLGSEDQGWVAHFLRQAIKREPITIYGDGKQVRDLLFVEDLVKAMRMAHGGMGSVSGEAFNLGGGPGNSTSLLELVHEIEALVGHSVKISWGPERLGDQKWYVADTAKISGALGWKPQTGIRDGLSALHNWYLARPDLVPQSEAQVA